MEQHVKILAVLNIVIGGLGVLAAIIVLLIFGGAAAAALFGNHGSSDAAIGASLVAIIGACVALFLLILSLPSVIAGMGLLKFRPWARLLTLVLSALHLLNIPIGTALGIYGFWVLLRPETEQLFARAA